MSACWPAGVGSRSIAAHLALRVLYGRGPPDKHDPEGHGAPTRRCRQGACPRPAPPAAPPAVPRAVPRAVLRAVPREAAGGSEPACPGPAGPAQSQPAPARRGRPSPPGRGSPAGLPGRQPCLPPSQVCPAPSAGPGRALPAAGARRASARRSHRPPLLRLVPRRFRAAPLRPPCCAASCRAAPVLRRSAPRAAPPRAAPLPCCAAPVPCRSRAVPGVAGWRGRGSRGVALPAGVPCDVPVTVGGQRHEVGGPGFSKRDKQHLSGICPLLPRV